jgi:DNA-binding transcriptional ArsR family regulator
MVQYQRPHLDASFAALSDATRRGILERLGRADASITELAGKFQMTLTGMKKHIGVLERTGLVTTAKAGRVRTCKLGPRRLEDAAAWIERYREIFEQKYQRLDALLEELQATPSKRTRTQASPDMSARCSPCRPQDGAHSR